MKLIDIIPSAIVIKGEFSETPLTDEGKEVYKKAYLFEGKFRFDESDWGVIAQIIANLYDSSNYKTFTRGYIAGHDLEFNGRLYIGIKK